MKEYKERVLAEWRKHPALARIAAVESMAQVHGTKDYEGQTISEFISQALDGQLEAQKVNIGMLRQWLNEDRIKDAKHFVTNEDLKHWLYWNLTSPSK